MEQRQNPSKKGFCESALVGTGRLQNYTNGEGDKCGCSYVASNGRECPYYQKETGNCGKEN